MMTSHLFDSNGHALAIGASVGRGGEGIVYELDNRPGFVLKTYHNSLNGLQADKLIAMSNQANEALLKIAAWPTEVVYSTNKKLDRDSIVGFLMPRITGYKPLHELYSPKSRRQEFPEASWRFLVHTAINLARAFTVIHENGCVVGDVNHGNALVSKNGTIVFIDCDSFQLKTPSRVYTCDVGVSTYVPPELQGKSYKGITRTSNHDCFGLAILIFQLLFMGRHPFSGSFLGQGDMSIERAISEFRFAYGSSSTYYMMKQPPNTLPLESVSSCVADLFERSFFTSGVQSRPTSKEWIDALQALQGTLVQCIYSEKHSYPSFLKNCPLCEIEAKTRTLLFGVTIVAKTRHSSGKFVLTELWASIIAVTPPQEVTPIDPSGIIVAPSAKSYKVGRLKKRNIFLGWSFIIASISFLLIVQSTLSLLSCILSLLLYSYLSSRSSHYIRPIQDRLRQMQLNYDQLKDKWDSGCTVYPFVKAFEELESNKNKLEQIPSEKARKLKSLENGKRIKQLERFLDSFCIEHFSIEGIGPSRKATLTSYGVETAADITHSAISSIPGFGPIFTNRLMNWRHSIESRFVFDPNRAVDPADRASVEQEFDSLTKSLEGHLISGPKYLTKVKLDIELRRQALLPELNEAGIALAQAKVDLEAAS